MGILSGKAVVITGAGRGLGRAFALHAAGEGAALVVNDVDAGPAEEVAAGIRESGGRAVAAAGSVTDPEHAAQIVERCVAEFGSLDGLVNNAGLRHRSALWDEDPGRARRLIEVNVLGPLYCGFAAAKAMRATGGTIVNIGSVSMVGQPNVTTYSASKGALASMTAGWAVELAGHGIRVNAVCPIAWTRMSLGDPNARDTPEASPDRTAPMVTYLLSDQSAGVTGQLIRFAGGRLHVISQTAPKSPVLHREEWDVQDIAEAFAGELTPEATPIERWR